MLLVGVPSRQVGEVFGQNVFVRHVAKTSDTPAHAPTVLNDQLCRVVIVTDNQARVLIAVNDHAVLTHVWHLSKLSMSLISSCPACQTPLAYLS